jgi:hypothetical protein
MNRTTRFHILVAFLFVTMGVRRVIASASFILWIGGMACCVDIIPCVVFRVCGGLSGPSVASDVVRIGRRRILRSVACGVELSSH